MTYKGHVKNGTIVLDDPVKLPEGAIIRFEIETGPGQPEKSMPTLAERYVDFIGKAVGLPEDAAENHDHYLYGLPKK